MKSFAILAFSLHFKIYKNLGSFYLFISGSYHFIYKKKEKSLTSRQNIQNIQKKQKKRFRLNISTDNTDSWQKNLTARSTVIYRKPVLNWALNKWNSCIMSRLDNGGWRRLGKFKPPTVWGEAIEPGDSDRYGGEAIEPGDSDRYRGEAIEHGDSGRYGGNRARRFRPVRRL